MPLPKPSGERALASSTASSGSTSPGAMGAFAELERAAILSCTASRSTSAVFAGAWHADIATPLPELERQAADKTQPEPERIEVPVVDEATVAALSRASARATESVAKLVESAEAALAPLREAAEKASQQLERTAPPVGALPPRPARAVERPPTPRPPRPRSTAEHAGADGDAGAPDGEIQLKASARRILEVLARHHPMTFSKAEVGTLTGFKITGGTFQSHWGALRRGGYLAEEDGRISVTEAGLERAGVEPEAPASTEEMVAMWSARLRKGAREMLDFLVSQHPTAVDRDASDTLFIGG